MKTYPRLVTDLAQMTIKQADILRSEGDFREASLLAEYGLALAFASAQTSSPRLVPAIARH